MNLGTVKNSKLKKKKNHMLNKSLYESRYISYVGELEKIVRENMLSCQVLEKLFGVSDPLSDIVESHQTSLGLSLSTCKVRELSHRIR